MLGKINHFLNSDFDKKLNLIFKKTKVNLAPKLYKINFVSSFYNDFFILLYSKLHPFNKLISIKKNINYVQNLNIRKNLLIAHVRSGGTYLRNLITTYYNLVISKKKIVLDYREKEDKFFFDYTPLITSDLWGFIEDCNHEAKKNFLINENVQGKFENIFFSRYPLGRFPNLLDIEYEHKSVLLIRNPSDIILSTVKLYHKLDRLKLYKNIDHMIKNIHDNLIKFLSFLKIKKTKHNLLVIDYDELLINPFNNLKKIFNSYNLFIDDGSIQNTIDLNQKKNYSKYIRSNSLRVSQKFINEDELKKKIIYIMSDNKVNFLYKSFFE